MVDDMGWSDLGCYGGEIQTPNLDNLAADGVRFRNFYNNAKCTTSRFSLLTGVYPSQAGLTGNIVTNLKNSTTIGEVLREAGYHTYASGKHHGLDNLYNRGFDRYYGLRDGACNHFNPGLQRAGEPAPGRKGFDREWCDDALLFDTRDPNYQSYFPSDFYTTDAFTERALGYIDEWDDQDTGRPFFLYLAYTAPHDPLMAWPEDIAKYEGVYDVGFDVIRAARYQKQQDLGLLSSSQFPLSASTYQNWSSLDAAEKEDQASRMEIHAAMVDRVDQKIGEVVEKLKDNGSFDNTLILFCSDNGAQRGNFSFGDSSLEMGTVGWYTALGTNWNNVSNTPFRFDKDSLYNGGSRTPMITHWPDGIANPGRFTDKNCHIIDYMATILELTDAEYPRVYNNQTIAPLEGESFAEILLDHTTTPRENPIFIRWLQERFVLDENYKAVSRNNGTTWMLYDLDEEGTEITDVSSQNPTKFNDLLTAYQNWETRAYDNELPRANDDQVLGVSSADNATIAVLMNDFDIDGTLDISTLTLTRLPLFGSAIVNGDGTITYTNDGSPVACDLFGYQVQDNDGQVSNEGLVTVGFSPTTEEFLFSQAEHLILSGSDVQTNAPAASGGAHVNFNANQPADYIEWPVSIESPGNYFLTLGYAMGDTPRVLDISVNGTIAEEDFSFPSTANWSTFQEINTPEFELFTGANIIRVSTNLNADGPNIDYLSLTQISQTESSCQTIEAESAMLSGADVQTNQPNASGGAHVNYVSTNPASYVEFSISAPEAGNYHFSLGYALGSSTRSLDLSVNGALIENDLSFLSTGSWSNFSQLELSEIALEAGTNIIHLSANVDLDGPNLDYLTFCLAEDDSNPPSVIDTDEDGLPDWFEDATPQLSASDPLDASLDFDHDGESNLFEFLANTDFTDTSSRTELSIQEVAEGQCLLSWSAFPGKPYQLHSSLSLVDWSAGTSVVTDHPTAQIWVSAKELEKFFRLSVSSE